MRSTREQKTETYYFRNREKVPPTYTILTAGRLRFAQLDGNKMEQVYTIEKIPVAKTNKKTKKVIEQVAITAVEPVKKTSFAKLPDCHIGQLFSPAKSNVTVTQKKTHKQKPASQVKRARVSHPLPRIERDKPVIKSASSIPRPQLYFFNGVEIAPTLDYTQQAGGYYVQLADGSIEEVFRQRRSTKQQDSLQQPFVKGGQFEQIVLSQVSSHPDSDAALLLAKELEESLVSCTVNLTRI